MKLPTDWSEFIDSLISKDLGPKELRANKQASGRPEDLADIALLDESEG